MLLGCESNNNSFELNGTTDLDDGVVIYRIVPNSVNQPIKMDSTVVRKGRFNFSSQVNEIDVNFITIRSRTNNLILSEGN